jgi:hypothetical protein
MFQAKTFWRCLRYEQQKLFIDWAKGKCIKEEMKYTGQVQRGHKGEGLLSEPLLSCVNNYNVNNMFRLHLSKHYIYSDNLSM